jgi:hypothetical protein
MHNNKEFEQLKKDYKIIFETAEGKRVLDDLSKRCHEFVTTHQKGDSHESAFLEGQRSVYVFIKAILQSKS